MQEGKNRCSQCGASRDYVKRTKTGWRCSICGREWKREKRKNRGGL